MHLLVIEDERVLCETIVRSLRRLAYSVDHCYDGDKALELLGTERYDLVLLDLNLPGKDGMTVLRTFRQRDRKTPVLILSARSEVKDKVEGLDAGANDYLAKPFGVMELVSRVKAVLRRVSHTAPSQVLTHKNITLNESSHQVFVDGNKIELTIKEYLLLRLFLKNPGVAFTRENLLSSVWESEYQGETRTVDVHIASLRTKLGSAGECIKTVRGVGYRMEDAQ